ncbi:MAG: nonstructural protein [Microviridae sp.]|nr:MAG: nonstructural protein [Microviridae sp.]
MKPIYAVKDLAVQVFGTPFFVRAKGEAIRSFQDEANNTSSDSAIAKHPEDYELYILGHYDEQTGQITPCDIELVARAKDLLRGV